MKIEPKNDASESSEFRQEIEMFAVIGMYAKNTAKYRPECI